jgi:mono/diheme cytochrome c family protein
MTSQIHCRSRWGIHVAAGAAIVLTACGPLTSSDDGASAPDSLAPTTESRGTTTTVESAISTTENATSTTVDDVAAAAPVGISFADEVLPILETNCASCHTSDGPGTAHLVLDKAGDITDFDAEYIAAVIDVGYMPPWPAADGDVAFHDDRRLDDATRATMASWVEDGGILDVDPDTPIVAPNGPAALNEIDAALTGEPYKGTVGNDADDYRCQIYDPELDADGFLTGYGFEPDQTEVVHHALLFHVRASAREAAEATAAANPDIGWACTGLAGFGDAGDTKQIMSWAPGQDPTVLPDDVGVAVGADDFFVVQIHYHYEPETANVPPDESTLLLDFADGDDLAAAGGSLDPIDLTLYLGPAEIPCSTSEIGPLCDRDAAVGNLIEEQGRFAGFVGNGLMAMCGATVADFADMTDGIASSSCDHRAQPGEIISIWGHEHEIGSAFRMTLNPDTPDERMLLDIPRWSFDWQLNYEPIEKIVLKPGDTIRVECEWDRSKIPDDAEPRYIVWSEGTNDEMCYSQIITKPV